MTKLESLPNEVLITCFGRLESFDMLFSFTRLNARFERLVGSIPLHLNFESMDQPKFDRFLTLIFSNENIPKQIHSLILSNAHARWQIQPFLSRLSSAQLTDLRALCLVEITKHNLDLIKSILPFLSQLFSFHYISHNEQVDHLPSLLPTTELKHLTIPELPEDDNTIAKLSSAINLSVCKCDKYKLTAILGKTSRLRHLTVQHWDDGNWGPETEDQSSLAKAAIDLKRLTIESMDSNCGTLRNIFRQMPNLTTLEINMNHDDYPIAAYAWEDLIKESLSCLKTFRFCFSYMDYITGSDVQMWFDEFQTDFWVKEHHWYTEYRISDGFAIIYTIPYMSKLYFLRSSIHKYSHSSINPMGKYNNVHGLLTYSGALTEEHQQHFPHVHSIFLRHPWNAKDDSSMTRKEIETLKTITNFSHLRHLEFSRQDIKPSMLLDICQEAPLISSLSVQFEYLDRLFCHSKLCQYLNTVIKKLKISSRKTTVFTLKQMQKFCQTFSSLEQLTCSIVDAENIVHLFEYLPHLSLVNFNDPDEYKFPSLDEQSLLSLEKRLQTLGQAILINSLPTMKMYCVRSVRTSLD